MKIPNFLIIGVQKAGTTSIYNYLKQHPQIYMSPVKETNFLERDWNQASSKTKANNRYQIDNWEKYCQLFQDVKDEIAIGEASPNYLFHYHSSSERIAHYLPDAKMIAFLRNPIDRAYSDYLMHIRDELNQQLTIAETVQQRPKSFMLRKGLYYTQLKHFIDTFGKEKIQVYLYDDFCQNPLVIMQDIYRFLGVDESFCPDMSRKAQTAEVPKSRWVNKLLRKQNPLRNSAATLLRLFLPEKSRQNLRSSLINLNAGDKNKLALTEQERTHLQEYYREDILKLQDLLATDLSLWLAK